MERPAGLSREFDHDTTPFLRDCPHWHRSALQLTGKSSYSLAMRGSGRKLHRQMCQPRWWGQSEQMHVLLRPAGDQMFDTRVSGTSRCVRLQSIRKVERHALTEAGCEGTITGGTCRICGRQGWLAIPRD